MNRVRKLSVLLWILLASSILIGSVAAAPSDGTDEEHTIPTPDPPSIVEPTNPLSGCRILFDAYRCTSWTPSTGYGFFGDLTKELEDRGCTVDELTGPITVTALDCYNVFVIASPESSTAYSSDEVTALSNFVSSGKGLFLLGEMGPAWWINYATLNSMANAFGVNFESSTSTWDPLTLTPPHPIFGDPQNVFDVRQANGDDFTILASEPVTVLGTNSIGNAIGVRSFGDGSVVFYTDCNTFDDQAAMSLYYYDHLQLALNIFDWLYVPPPCGVPEFGLSSSMITSIAVAVYILVRQRKIKKVLP